MGPSAARSRQASTPGSRRRPGRQGRRAPVGQLRSRRRSGTPYERATIAPVSSTHPTPSAMPSAAVRSSVPSGQIAKASVSCRYSRNNSGSPRAATVISAAGIRSVANVTSASSTTSQHDPEQHAGPVRQLREQRTGQRRPQQVLTGGGPKCARPQPGRPVSGTRVQAVAAQPAEFACGNIGLADPALHRGGTVSAGPCAVLMRRRLGERAGCGRGYRRRACRGR